MKKLIISGIVGILVITSFILISCNDDNSSSTIEPVDRFQQFTIDTTLINEYILANNVQNVSINPNGIRYVIDNEGTGDNPTPDDEIVVNYKGRLLNGEVFDEGTRSRFSLRSLIVAWQKCLPLIKENGSMTIYTPSFYGYGQRGTESIPPNSVIIFEIDLIEVLN